MAASTTALALVTLCASSQEAGFWQPGVDSPSPRSEIALAEADGKVYVIGDYNGAVDMLIYDLNEGTWAVGQPFPNLVHHPVAAAADGRIYVFGGYVDGWNSSDAV